MTDWYFILNPHAGSGKTMSEWEKAEKLLSSAGVSFTTVHTVRKGHAASLAAEAAASGYRRIVAVGGDGSVHDVLQGIASWCAESGVDSSSFTLGVIPIGSGNDWIKSLGVPHDLEKVVQMIATGSTAPMDLVSVRLSEGSVVSYMANIGGTGFDSHVCERVNAQKEAGKRGRRIYLNALIHTIFNISSVNLRVVADGRDVFEGPCYSIALGNGKYSGSGMRQVPLATIDDGLLDYMIVPKVSVTRILQEIPRLFRGNVHKSPTVISGRCRSLMILPLDSASADIVELDGEIAGTLPLAIEMDGKVIQAVAPGKTE